MMYKPNQTTPTVKCSFLPTDNHNKILLLITMIIESRVRIYQKWHLENIVLIPVNVEN
jgi:hypothetical protein